MERVLYEQKLEYQENSLEKDRNYKREYYYRLLHDEKFAQRVIREKLGFADPRDIVFRFEDSVPTTIDDGIMPHFAPPVPKRFCSLLRPRCQTPRRKPKSKTRRASPFCAGLCAAILAAGQPRNLP